MTIDKSKPLAIGADHAGFEYKQMIADYLKNEGWQVTDKGTYNNASCDYPDYAHAVAEEIESGRSEAGILVCGSGNGVCMAANKHASIRAALCWTEEVASLARSHNDANVICIPARFVTPQLTIDMLNAFLSVEFEGGRHQRRVEKI